MAYTPLNQKYFTPYHQIPNRLLKKESIKYQVFLKAVGNYALTVDSGFDTLLLNKQMECGVHLLRMLLDASIKTYGLLLAKNPDKYINDFLKGVHKGEYASRSENKYDGKNLTAGNIIEYMEKDGYPIRKFYEDASNYVHPSNFYCLGVELDEDTRKWLWDSQDEALIHHYGNLRDRKERFWVYDVMGLINDLILEVMAKVVEMVEPKPVAPLKIDFESGKLVPNTESPKILTNIENICGGFVEGEVEDGSLYTDIIKPNGIYCGYITASKVNPKGVSIWCNESLGDTLLIADAPDELTIEYENRSNKENPNMFWMGYVKDNNILISFYPDGISKDKAISNLKEWNSKI